MYISFGSTDHSKCDQSIPKEHIARLLLSAPFVAHWVLTAYNEAFPSSRRTDCRIDPMDLRDGISSDEDRFSLLPDDILLSILGRVDITTAVRTSVLSLRWKHLPWLLHDVTMDVKDFLPVLQPKHIEIEHMDEAMSSLIQVARSFLATPRTEGAITRLQVNFYLINNYAREIGPLVSEAIDIGNIKDLNLAVLDEKEVADCNEQQMLQQGYVVNGFFTAYPSIFHCLTELSLYNVRSANRKIHRHLFECCNKIQNLYISNCDLGICKVWKIDAPNSNLHVLRLHACMLRRLDVLCLPKLERLEWETWFRFVLSEVLSTTTSTDTVKVDFQGEKLWMQPEGTQLHTAFKKLKKLSLHGIFVEFSLLWTIVLLEAAPLLKMFDIEIWEHPCEVNDTREIIVDERVDPSWQVPEFTGQTNSFMKGLQIVGFKPLKQQIEFVRAVMQRAPSLDTVLLKYDDPCKDCEKMGFLPPRSSTACVFPKNKDEQDMVVKILRDGISSHARIIFGN
ncbi:hypothetical protein ACP4OV_028380 [Aristida adscensionis]